MTIALLPNPIPTPPPAELYQDAKAYAGLAHVLMISTWWVGPVGPLIIFIIKRSSRFVSFHPLQALFWQIIFTLLYVCGMTLIFATAFGTMACMPQQKTADAPFPTALFRCYAVLLAHHDGGFATSL